jgi:hypothetical protein
VVTLSKGFHQDSIRRGSTLWQLTEKQDWEGNLADTDRMFPQDITPEGLKQIDPIIFAPPRASCPSPTRIRNRLWSGCAATDTAKMIGDHFPATLASPPENRGSRMTPFAEDRQIEG